MKKFTILLTFAVLLSCVSNLFAAAREFTGTELKRHLRISRAADQKSAESLAIKTTGTHQSALYQSGLSWQTGEIKQIIVNARIDRPGRLRFSCNTVVDGQKLSLDVFLPAVTDGKFHDYIFDLSGEKNWQGIMTNYELRWFGPENTLLEVRRLAVSDSLTIKLAGSQLKSKVRLFKARPIAAENELLAQTTGTFGGFHQQSLAWNANDINTVSFMFKSNKPGQLRFACSLKNAPVSSLNMPQQQVPGDDRYHLYTFDLSDNLNYAGIQTNYELRFSGEKGAIIGLKEMTAGKKEVTRKPEDAITAYRYELKTFSSAGADGIVKCGEPVTLKVQALRNGQPIDDPEMFLYVRCFSDGEGSKVIRAPIDKEFVYSFTRDQPGRTYISCRIISKKYPNTRIMVSNPRSSSHLLAEHGIGIWADPHKQRIQRQEPPDFDRFWADRKAELAQVPLKVLEKVPFDANGKDSFDIYDVKIACAGPTPVSGIITIPKDRSRKYPVIVRFHGAGVRSAIVYTQPGAITFDVNAHGLPNGRETAFYTAILRDNSRNPYKQSAEKRFELFKYMFMRALRALEYARTLPEWNGKDLIVAGGSQGGLQSIAAAALDKSVTLAAPAIPAMIGVAEFTIIKNVEAAWPEPYTKAFYAGEDITTIAKKFDYIDGAFLIRRINCPVYISIGLYDALAAHVFAAFNDCPSPQKSISSIPDMGHYDYNPQGRQAISRVVEGK